MNETAPRGRRQIDSVGKKGKWRVFLMTGGGEGINRSDECVSGKEKRRGKGGRLVTVSAQTRGELAESCWSARC